MTADISSAGATRSFLHRSPGFSPRRFPRWLQFGFWFCIAIAIAAVLLRAFAMLHPAVAPRELAQLDAAFNSHAALTWTHILCALVFVSLLPFLFWKRTQDSRRLQRAFLFSLARVMIMGRRQDTLNERRWMIRAVAIVFGIAAARPVMGVFFATSALTHLTARQFFGIAFWIGFSLTTITAELWLRRSRFARE